MAYRKMNERKAFMAGYQAGKLKNMYRKHASADDTMYEAANDIFDEIVFAYDDRALDIYNDEGDGELHDELFSIIAAMVERAEGAMIDCAREYKDDFLYMVYESVGEGY